MSWKNEFSTDFAVPIQIDHLVSLGILVDTSWHNDVCPSFSNDGEEANGSIVLWVDHPNPDEREMGGCRFTIVRVVGECYSENEVVYATDDLYEMLDELRLLLRNLEGTEVTDR